MDAPVTLQDLVLSAPFTIVAATALLVLLIEAVGKRSEQVSFWVSLAGLVAAGAAAFVSIGDRGIAYAGMVTTGGVASYFALLFCVAGALSVLLSRSYLRRAGLDHGEYYALLLLAVAGMMLMAASADLVVFFLGLELMSICFYVLAGFARTRMTSNEAALKYFLLGSFATGFLLYGISLVYGSTGTTAIAPIVTAAAGHASSPLFIIGVALILIGLAFKVAAVPFHMWVPDVYEGAPTTVSGLMSTGGKAAAFSGFLLVFAPALVSSLDQVRTVVAAVAAVSMVAGNVIAISQTSVKRMLAYSSIAHAGYILVGIVAANEAGWNGILFYLMAYTVMNIGAFGVVSVAESAEGRNLLFDDYGGLSVRKPFLAFLMALFMFSLAGVPPFAGFFGKYYVFAGAIGAGYTWLAILGVLMSVVSAYYYLRLVVLMYFRENVGTDDVATPVMASAALVLSAAAVVALGLFPSAIVDLTRRLF